MGHELGHSFGLGHTGASGCTNIKLMVPTTSQRYDTCGVYRPQQDGVDGINAIY